MDSEKRMTTVSVSLISQKIITWQLRKHGSKSVTHLITYCSGTNATQIDCILVRRRDLKDVVDAKVIPYATQHRQLICKLRIKLPSNKHVDHTGPARSNCGNSRLQKLASYPKLLCHQITTNDESWKKLKESAHEAAHAILGTTKPGRRRIDRDTWLWNDTVKDAVHTKKRFYHAFLADKTPEQWNAYRIARKDAKQAIAATKSSRYADLYAKRDTREGERDLYRLPKARHRNSDVHRFYGVND
ncbi:uncharacterized protein LOC126249467 [Schistocerca nitens]|uniref:uncharacterized protein LOC126249467 n=1 Tax=Schistocerca nitens TaxID=7011 RepID=UPI0021184DD5|nr:uncharacterized protein LOC126249467 [Schistocerca nitens]